MLSVEVTECKPLSERKKNVEVNYIMKSGKWISSAYQFSGKWDNENNAIRRNLNAWVRLALRFVHQQKAPGFIEIWVLFFLLKLVYKARYITERFAIRAAFVTICTYFQQNRMIV